MERGLLQAIVVHVILPLLFRQKKRRLCQLRWIYFCPQKLCSKPLLISQDLFSGRRHCIISNMCVPFRPEDTRLRKAAHCYVHEQNEPQFPTNNAPKVCPYCVECIQPRRVSVEVTVPHICWGHSQVAHTFFFFFSAATLIRTILCLSCIPPPTVQPPPAHTYEHLIWAAVSPHRHRCWYQAVASLLSPGDR